MTMSNNDPEPYINRLTKWADVKDNMCEICGNQATAGILGDERQVQTRIRYSCQDHYMKVYDRIAAERREEMELNDRKK